MLAQAVWAACLGGLLCSALPALTLVADGADDLLCRALSAPRAELSAAAVWRHPARLAEPTGELVLSTTSCADWPDDLVARRAAQLASVAAERLVVVVTGPEPAGRWQRRALMQATAPGLLVVDQDDLQATSDFASLRRRARDLATVGALSAHGVVGEGPARLLLRNLLADATTCRLTAFEPRTLFGADLVTVDVGPRATAVVPVLEGATRESWWIGVSVGGGAPVPARVAVAARGVLARWRRGRQVTFGPPGLALDLTRVEAPKRSVRVTGRPGLPALRATLDPARTVTVDVPVTSPSGFVRRVETAEVEVEFAVTRVQALIGAVPALVPRPCRVVLDGRLDEWRDTAWHAVEDQGQLVAGAASWRGPADAGLRFSVAGDETNLYLAWTVTDDVAGPADGLTVCWDPAVSAGGAPGGEVRQLSIARAAGGESASGWHGEFALRRDSLGLDEAAHPIGFDLSLTDDDPGQPVARLAWSGERWAVEDPARLGLLLPGPDATPWVRWWVQPSAGPGGATGN